MTDEIKYTSTIEISNDIAAKIRVSLFTSHVITIGASVAGLHQDITLSLENAMALRDSLNECLFSEFDAK
jgi:hypothetical protein